MRRFLGLSLLALLPALAGANECRYSAERNFDVDAAALKTIAFDLSSSDLILEGVPGLAKVEVRGRACAAEEAWLDQLTVDQHVSGDRLQIAPHNGHDQDSWFGSSYAYVDIRVRVPTKLAAIVKSESGDADVSNIAALDYDASSGDLKVNDVSGMLQVEVSSGDVRGRDIGSVEVRGTSSGDISLTDVHGQIDVSHSGSGDLSFDDVGSVHVGSTGSGDIVVAHAGSDVIVDSIGSGDVSVRDVGGNFTVGSKGSGDVHHSNVRGKVDVPHDDDDDD